MLEQTLHHLQPLVSLDTRHPPPPLTTGGIFHYPPAHLPGVTLAVIGHAARAVRRSALREARLRANPAVGEAVSSEHLASTLCPMHSSRVRIVSTRLPMPSSRGTPVLL